VALARFVPAGSWLPRYQRGWLTGDAVAGFTIWGLLVPEMIAYASLAGLPPQAGLYTLLASLVLYAIFGTSRQLVVAGTSASAVLVFSGVTALKPANPAAYATLAAGMIIFTGLIFIIAGLLRLGFITAFLSRPVMVGFVFGLAIFVIVSQLPKLFGLTKGPGDTIRQFVYLIGHLGDTSLVTFAVGAVALVLLFALERYLPRVPGGLVVLVLAIVVSTAFGLSGHGVDVVGKIPTGLPSVSWPHVTVSQLWVLLPSAGGMMLVIFSEALGAGQTFADKHGYQLHNSQEMIALGLANLGSGVLGGLACGGSLSQTAVNDGAGARSELSPVIAAALSLVTVIALTPLFTDLPEAVLAALIIHAVSHLMRVGEMRRFYRLIPREFWLGMITLAGVIVLNVLPGLILGVATALVLLIYRSSRPQISILGADRSIPGAFEDIRRQPDAVPVPGLLIIRPNATLFYANAKLVRDAIEHAVAASPAAVYAVVLDLDANDDLDITSTEQLEKLTDHLQARHIAFSIAHMHDPAMQIARRAGLLAKIGPGNVFADTAAAVAWARARMVEHGQEEQVTSAAAEPPEDTAGGMT
jgi:high affinity sulfate transporter 1